MPENQDSQQTKQADSMKSPFMKELYVRGASSVVIASAVLGGIFVGGWAWVFVVSVISLTSLWEFYGLLRARYRVSIGVGLGAGVIVLLCAAANLSLSAILSVLSIISFLVLFVEILRKQATDESFALYNIGGTLAGVVYVVLPWSFMVIIRDQTWGHLFLLTLFLCTWACDVAAWFVGKRWGRSLLCDRVSPKKTWEGFFGGLMGSVVTGGLLAAVFQFPPLPLMLLGALCGVAGQLGDLGESVLKREAGVKDTGAIIPGHGGMLDRFDSILINAALAFLIFEVIVR